MPKLAEQYCLQNPGLWGPFPLSLSVPAPPATLCIAPLWPGRPSPGTAPTACPKGGSASLEVVQLPGTPQRPFRPPPVAWKCALDSDVTQGGGSSLARTPMARPPRASSFPVIGVSGPSAPPRPAMASGAVAPGRWFPL